MPRRLFEELRQSNPPLAHELERICEEAAEIWAHQRLYEFTVHGGPHTAQVEENLDSLTVHLQRSANRLAPEEIFVLIAACHLHDIGMQLGLSNARENHAEYAYKLILYSSAQIGPEQRRVTLSISNPNAQTAIAEVARGHWTGFALRLPEEDYIFENERGRLKLLGLLLATADLLDTSAVRAGYFRSEHRLFDLGPIGELHQTMHHLVCGYQIRPASSEVPDKLVFELDWRDRSDLAQQMSEWQLWWFASQLRQLSPALERLSGGTIRWEIPWARVNFREPKGPMPSLSEAGQRELLAALEAQRRIDRDAFAGEFLRALRTPCSSVFVLPNASQSDARQLADWCKAQAQTEEECLVGRIDVASGAPLDLASLIADLLEQWNEHLPACEDDVAIGRLKGFVGDHCGQKFMLLVVADRYSQELLQPVLDTVLQRTGDEDSRVCVLVCRAGEVPSPIVGAVVRPVELGSFSSEDVGGYLERQYGYDAQGGGELITRMERLGLLSTPARVYTYIEVQCDREAWQNRFPEGAAGARPN